MDPTRIVLAGVVILAAVLAAALVAVLICLKKSHNEARLLKEQLDSTIKTDERRISFFSSMVHELKMPLSVILGAVQLIEIKQKNMQQDEKKTNGTAIQETAHMEKNIAAIKHNCHRMMKLTNDLIDLAKSETGYLRLRPVNCDLCALLDEIVQSVQPYALKKQLDLRFEKRACGRIIVALDMEKTERIMLNLLSNAVKFTDPGGSITVSAYTADGRVYISVKDTGTGIPADKQDEIFDLYKQSGLHPCAEKEGFGIGLFLVKKFVELHRGNIRLISNKDMGSEFIIDLPAETVKSSQKAPDADDPGLMVGDAVSTDFSGGHSVIS